MLLGRAAGDDPPSVKAALALAGDTTKRLPPGAPPLAPPELTETLDEAPPSGGAPLVRRTIGGHELVGELGRGGMGVVYRARDPRLGRDVALKVINSAAADPEELSRFEREARAAARVQHPGVVAVHGAGVDEGRPWLSLQLVEGESLRAGLQRDGPLGFARAAEVAEAVARALQAAHDACVLHRDVKPHNVLLTPEGQPLLTDFGLARAVEPEDGLTVTGQVIGTPAYMSPEQAEGDQARVDARTDIYGLGATLYEMLTGQPPFQGTSALQVLARVLEQAPTPPSRLRADVPRDLETICLACLAKAPEARYATAGAVADDLRRFLDHRPIVARRAGPLARARLWARRHRRPLRALSLVAAASLPLASWWRAREAAAALQLQLTSSEQRLVPEDALDRLDALIALAPVLADRPAHAAALWARRARVHLARGAHELALTDLDRAILLAPHAETLALRAYVRSLVGGDTVTVLADADAALALDPRSALALRSRAVVLRVTGDLPGALRAADALVAEAADADAYRIRAGLLTAQGRFSEALADLERGIELTGGTSPGAWSDRGQLRLQIGDRTGAAADLARALALEPADATAIVGCVLLLMQLGRLEEANEFLERVEARHPAAGLSPVDAAHVLLQRARARLAVGRAPADALADAEAALARAPAGLRARLHLVRAEALLRLRRDVDAEAAVQLALRAAETIDGRCLRARLHNRAGRGARALEDATWVLSLVPGEPRALTERALALFALDLADQAAQAADEAVGRAPDHARGWACRALVRLCRGREDAAGAEADARHALELVPDLEEAHLALGLALGYQGKRAAAAESLERALELLGADHALSGFAEEGLRQLGRR
ncbi:MAG: protein kinase [Planctomycetes bacterium]|nr:protein kinase [Planctomycetota bacterium]